MSTDSMSFRPNLPKHAGIAHAIRNSRLGWCSVVAMLLGLTLGCGDGGAGDVAGSQGAVPQPGLEVELPEGLKAITDGLYAESPADRAYAASCLGKLGPDASPAAPYLIDRLNDPDWLVRRQAAEALGAVEDAQAVGPLIEILADRDGEWGVRTAAARSLGQLGDPRAVETLIGVLNDMNAHVRHMAVIALGRIGTPETLEPLAAAARSDRDEATRFSAADALRQLESAQPAEDSP